MRKLLNRVERAIDLPLLHLTYYLIGGQIIVFAITMLYPAYRDMFTLRGNLILAGEWWRTVTFLFEPIVTDIIFAIFTWYLFYIYGSTLERFWGTTRFLMYIVIAALGTLITAFIFPTTAFSNGYIFNSLFLAFAFLFPEFELRLFFVIPVKIKWLAIISWIVTGLSLIIAPVPQKISILVSILNFAIFFGEDVLQLLKERARRSLQPAPLGVKKIAAKQPMHECSVCGKNSIDDPYMGIRYCTTCMPERCFCEKDFQKHSHPVN